MKKTVLLLFAVFTISVVNAQGSGTNWLKLGAHVGLPIGDVSDAYSFMSGVDVKYQFLGLDSFALGAATGYSNYFGKEINGSKIPNSSFIPLAALLRYYSTSNFFIGTDLGYAITLKDGQKGGFYYRPEAGYHNEKWNIYAFYQGVATDGVSINAVGVGVSFNAIRRRK